MTAHTLLQSAQLREIEKAHANAQPPLMERAGKAAAELALKLQSGLTGPPLIFAGPGNNGGDAFVVARILKQRGLDPVVVFLGHADKLPADARRAWERWTAIGRCHDDVPVQEYGLVVDGLFGIGLTRPLAEPWLSWIARINAAARIHGTTYSKLIFSLEKKQVGINRKVLADLAANHQAAFAEVVKFATS